MLEKLFYKQLDIQGQYISLNDKTIKAIIHKVDSSESVPKGTIMSEEELKNGDILTIDNKKYMIVDTYKPTNKCYYTGEYMMAVLVYYNVNSVDSKPNTSHSMYGVVSKLNNTLDSNGGILTTINNDYQFIVNSKDIGLDVTSGYLSACGVNTSIQIVDRTKENLYYYTTNWKGYYNVAPDRYVITLETNSINLNQNVTTYQINATCTLNDNVEENPTITYKSSDETIGTVSSSGLITITPVSEGESKTFTVTCKYHDSTAILTVNVVYEDVYTISITPNTCSLGNGQTYQLSPVCTKNGVTVENPIITYSSDNTNATISDTGLISVVSTDTEQTANITMTYQGQSCTLVLTIKSNSKEYELYSTNNNWNDKYAVNHGVNLRVYKNKTYTFGIRDKNTLEVDNEPWTMTGYMNDMGGNVAPDVEDSTSWKSINKSYQDEVTITKDDTSNNFTVTTKGTYNGVFFLYKFVNGDTTLYVKIQNKRSS